jgi:hypothetical protein
LTGTTSRNKSLPHAQVSSVKNYSHDNVEFEVEKSINTQPETNSQLHNSNNLIKKCIFKYQDFYKFTRLIVDDSFQFDSHFESANLHTVFRILTYQEATSSGLSFKYHNYDLFMHNDLFTSGNTQWFYFKISNLKAGQIATFNLKNFRKSDSLFKRGMKPLVYSKISGQWTRNCYNIDYLPSQDSNSFEFQSVVRDLKSDDCNTKKKSKLNAYEVYFNLSFTYEVENDDDECYFAYCYPYTYTDLQRYLDNIQSNEISNHTHNLNTKSMNHKNNKHVKSTILKRSLLCNTIAKNRCDLLTITNPAATIEDLKKRSVILISARVHPGETNASFIMHGIIEFLMNKTNEQANILRNNYIFKIIPMLNPDGVVNGNYRASLAGCDLNRKWRNPDPLKHPTLYHTKELIKRLKLSFSVSFLLDLHGHSIKKGIYLFIYIIFFF